MNKKNIDSIFYFSVSSFYLFILLLLFIFYEFKNFKNVKYKTEFIKDESEYYVKLLKDKEYYFELINLLKKAEKEIDILMLVIEPKWNKLDDPVIKILDSFIEASKRGVKVNIILEQTLENQKNIKGSIPTNQEVVDYFERYKNIKAVLAPENIRIHDKFILIDDEYVLLGNHNLTWTSLFKNNEVSVLIKSFPFNQEFKEHFINVRDRLGYR